MASQGPNPRTAKRTTHTSPAVQFNPNPQQADAIAHMNGPAAFIAAAGTGKTAILVQRLVRLVADERLRPKLFSV